MASRWRSNASLATERCYIGLGSNMGDRRATLESALAHLQRRAAIEVTAVSSTYETSPVGPVAQADFLNAAAELRTSLEPHRLLEALLSTESDHGRRRGERWGPRRLDLDLLLMGDRRLEEPGLTIPHPYLARRRFVLEPLLEIAPDLVHPVSGERLAGVLANLKTGERVRRAGRLRIEERRSLLRDPIGSGPDG